MGLVNLLLLDILETSIYLGAIQSTNYTCMEEEHFHAPFVERTIFTCNNENFQKKSCGCGGYIF
jgi:hypothetical protein